MDNRQIFQTDSASRWQRAKWASRILLLILPLGLLVYGITVIQDKNPIIPELRAKGEKKLPIDPKGFLNKNSLLARRYKGFRSFIDAKEVHGNTYHRQKATASFNQIAAGTMPCSIRAAFYVTWDSLSYHSLQRNIGKLNLVLPEWLFINPNGDTVYTTIDARGFALMRQAGVNIMPILSNFSGKDFNGATVHRIITNPAKRERLISDLIRILKQNHFAGINIDLEELTEDSDEAFVAFQKELYQRLHEQDLLVTQDVVPFNDDYNYNSLAAYNDYIFVMAYDEFSNTTGPGPIAEQKWIEAAVDAAVKKVPAQKLILSLAAYGYDWLKGSPTVNLRYDDAIETAEGADEKIIYDNDTYNLHFSYEDEDGDAHSVYFTDAATTFNTMRFAVESSLAGVALWRLGGEDSRIWKFYNKDLSKAAIRSFDFSTFSRLSSSGNIDYNNSRGDVLDVRENPTPGRAAPQVDTTDMLVSEEEYVSLPSLFTAAKYGWNGADTIRNKKKLVLTFDDGPDPRWTPDILDILAEKGVPASFFIVGLNAENHIPLVERIYREGHEIGDHTFTHPNIAEVSKTRAIAEIEATRVLIECITGHSTILFRAPFNADFQPGSLEELLPVALARTKNFLDIGESIDPLDWEPGVTADTIVRRVIEAKKRRTAEGEGGNIILLHDAGGDTRKETLKALPRIIDYFKSRGYTFTTIADLLGKKKDELMPPVAGENGFLLIRASSFFAKMVYWLGKILFSLFIVFMILSIARILVMAVLAISEKRKESKAAFLLPPVAARPLVSIIVPAYNEEVNAVASLHNLLKADYPAFEIIFVDDGSRDATYEKVTAAFKDHPKVKVFTKPNGGKSSALNFGISVSGADYVVCIDADTKLRPDAVSQLMKHFLVPGSGQVAAVAGNVKVGNEVNMLTKWQAIEYISSQNFDRRAFAYLNAITVVPGAIGAFRRAALDEAGGFTTDTLAEDCDLTIRILRAGYVVKNETGALAFTEAPEKPGQFIKQRFRWSFGVLQTFWKHKDLLFNTKYKWLGWLAMPNMLLFQYIIPSFIPLADVFMLVGLLTGNAQVILPYYVIFMLLDAGIALLAFRMEGESLGRLLWVIPQRLIYRWLTWYILFKAVRRAIKGELQNWGVLKRTGRVKEVGAG